MSIRLFNCVFSLWLAIFAYIYPSHIIVEQVWIVQLTVQHNVYRCTPFCIPCWTPQCIPHNLQELSKHVYRFKYEKEVCKLQQQQNKVVRFKQEETTTMKNFLFFFSFFIKKSQTHALRPRLSDWIFFKLNKIHVTRGHHTCDNI